jgi:hypothetical protein
MTISSYPYVNNNQIINQGLSDTPPTQYNRDLYATFLDIPSNPSNIFNYFPEGTPTQAELQKQAQQAQSVPNPFFLEAQQQAQSPNDPFNLFYKLLNEENVDDVTSNNEKQLFDILIANDKKDGSDVSGDIFALDNTDLQKISADYKLNWQQQLKLDDIISRQQTQEKTKIVSALEAPLGQDNGAYLTQMLLDYDKNNDQKTIQLNSSIEKNDITLINTNLLFEDDKAGTIHDIDAVDIKGFIEHTGIDPEYQQKLEYLVKSQQGIPPQPQMPINQGLEQLISGFIAQMSNLLNGFFNNQNKMPTTPPTPQPLANPFFPTEPQKTVMPTQSQAIIEDFNLDRLKNDLMNSIKTV